MRVSRLPLSLLFGFSLALVSVSLRADDTVRTLKAEISEPDAAHFAVENLLGTMRISVGSGAAVTVVATVYAESPELADAVRLERMAGQGGAATLRVRYPYDKVSTFRYREPSDRGDSGFGGWASSSDYDYDGHRVRVSRGRGKRLYADVEIQVPAGRLNAGFRNLAGLVEAEGLRGQVRFGVGSADLRLRRLDGDFELDGSSGDVRARDIKGSWKSDFSSGDTDLDGFEGESLSFQASSGDIVLRSIRAKRADFDTSSGDVRLLDADLEEFSAKATSGDVAFSAAGSALKQVRITTSSGDVSLHLPSNAAFEIDASQSSGEMEVGFSDGTAVRHRATLVGYRRGTGGARIHVRTSSGDLSVFPG